MSKKRPTSESRLLSIFRSFIFMQVQSVSYYGQTFYSLEEVKKYIRNSKTASAV